MCNTWYDTWYIMKEAQYRPLSRRRRRSHLTTAVPMFKPFDRKLYVLVDTSNTVHCWFMHRSVSTDSSVVAFDVL